MKDKKTGIVNKFNIFEDLANNPQKGTFTLAMGSLAIVIFMFVVAIRPAVISVVAQLENNKTRSELHEAQKQKLAQLQTLAQQRSDFAVQIELLDEALTNHDDSEFVLQNISEYARSTGDVDIESVTFDHEIVELVRISTPLRVRVVEVSIVFGTNVEQASEFLKFLETFPKPLNIKTVGLVPSRNPNTSSPITGNVKLVFYYIEEPKTNINSVTTP